jgi:hypothetical protein
MPSVPGGFEIARLRAVRSRLLSCWQHPRRRRAAAAAWATLAAPAVLALLAAQSAGGDGAPDMAEALVRRLYDPRRLFPVPARTLSTAGDASRMLPPAITVSR